MPDNIMPEQYRAEITNLNHELSVLKAQVEQSNIIDNFNPFDNPTENREYNGDYAEIVPQIEIPGCKIPVEPNDREKKKIRRFYNIAGCSIVLHEILVYILMLVMYAVVSLILKAKNPDADGSLLSGYQTSSSILMGVNLIAFLVCNVSIAFLGLKWAKIKPSTLIKTTDFNFAKAFQYCLIGMFLHYVAAYCSTGISSIIEHYGYTVYSVSDAFSYECITGKFVTILYACIVAPITEELFYRGMLLKLFSKANQRFAIVITAVIFGLIHGTVSQFSLGFFLGLFLAHLAIKHNSIIPGIIVHMFVNSCATIISELYDITNSSMMFALNFGYIILAFAGLIMLIEFRLKNKIPSTTPQQSRRGLAIAKTSVPVIVVFVMYIVEMIKNIVSVS